MFWIIVVRVSMNSLYLPGNLPAVFLCLENRTKFEFFFLPHGRGVGNAAVVHSRWQCIHTIQSRTYTQWLRLYVRDLFFHLHTVMQSQPVWTWHTNSSVSENNCCHRSWLVESEETPTWLVHLYSIMKQFFNGETGCLQVGLCVCGVFEINRRRRRKDFFLLFFLSILWMYQVLAGLCSLLITWSVCCVCLSYPH